MMTSIESYVRAGQVQLRKLLLRPEIRLGGKVTGLFFAGFLLSAASLRNTPQPLLLGLLLSAHGWAVPVLAAGGAAGYWLLWGSSGFAGLGWMLLGLPLGCLTERKEGLLLPASAALTVAATGLLLQLRLDFQTPIPAYLMQVLVGGCSVVLCRKVLARSDPVWDWIAEGCCVLALAQFSLFPGGNLGCIGAGMLGAWGSLPAGALAGLALDVTRVSVTPMTAVVCLAFLTRLLPWHQPWLSRLAPGVVYLAVMGLCGSWDVLPAIGLAIGGGLSVLLPAGVPIHRRRGSSGAAQVHLELMASCLSQTQQLLLETPVPPIDEAAILQRAQSRACGSCPLRRSCAQPPLEEKLLHVFLTDTASLRFPCKKPARMIAELRRAQEQLRTLQADRARRTEYRWAVVQQYRFLADYLREQADDLSGKSPLRQRFSPLVQVRSRAREADNGDRCTCFSGTQGRYFVLLCDGMGTGQAAAQESKTVSQLLRQMLSAGFPAEYALRSVNSLLALRGCSGGATMDLAEIRLDSGRGTVYKWGAAPSLVLRQNAAERIGTGTPPPGISVTEGRETVDRLSLRRGETLILLTDGVDGDEAIRCLQNAQTLSPEQLPDRILQSAARQPADDATVAAIRLVPA